MTGAHLELAAIGKSFRGLRAVHDVSFAVPSGAIHALIGPNGAGKTTIFNMIAGVYPPDLGTVSLDGRRISGLRPDRVCGLPSSSCGLSSVWTLRPACQASATSSALTPWGHITGSSRLQAPWV